MRPSWERISVPSGHSFRVYRWQKNLHDVEVFVEPGAMQPTEGQGAQWHYHVQMELTLFTEASGTRFVGDHIGSFASGEVVLLGEKLPHHWRAIGVCAGIGIQWHFPNEHSLWAFPEAASLGALFKNAGRGLRFVGPTAATLSAEMRQLAATGGLVRLGQLFRLFGIMADAPPADRVLLCSDTFSISTEDVYQHAITQAVRFLLADFREPVRLETLLKLTGLSKPTFSRQFKMQTGKSFRDFIAHARLHAATRELAETELSILEIALACGFTQVSFFNRIFRRVFRCSPSQYRARCRRQNSKQPSAKRSS